MAWLEIDYELKQDLCAGIKYAEVVPGLFARGPGSMDHVGGEDLWGISTVKARAEAIDNYLNKHLGTYNVHTPNKTALVNWAMFEWRKPWNIFKHFIGRHVGLWAHIRMCAGRKLNWFFRWRWSRDAIATANGTDQDGLMHTYQSMIMFNAIGPECKMMTAALDHWKKKKIDMPGVYAAYIGDPKHPLVVAAALAKARWGF
jgi:hypothetical protein